MEDFKLNLNITVAELNLILGGLQELPYKLTNGLIKSLVEEAQLQIDANGKK